MGGLARPPVAGGTARPRARRACGALRARTVHTTDRAWTNSAASDPVDVRRVAETAKTREPIYTKDCRRLAKRTDLCTLVYRMVYNDVRTGTLTREDTR